MGFHSFPQEIAGMVFHSFPQEIDGWASTHFLRKSLDVDRLRVKLTIR